MDKEITKKYSSLVGILLVYAGESEGRSSCLAWRSHRFNPETTCMEVRYNQWTLPGVALNF